MFSSRIARIQAAATCERRNATLRALIPQRRGEARGGSNAQALLGPARWPQPFDHHPIPPRGRGQDAVGRRARRSIPFLDGVVRVASGPIRIADSAGRGPAPRPPHRHGTQPIQREPETRPASRSLWDPAPRLFTFARATQSRPGRRGTPGTPLGRGSRRRRRRGRTRSASATRLPAHRAGATLTGPGASPGSIPTNQQETRTQ